MLNKKYFSVLLSGILFFSMNGYANSLENTDVVVETLPALTSNTIGTRSTTNVHLWSGTSAHQLTKLFNQIAYSNLTPAEMQLVTHLLTLDTSGSITTDFDQTHALAFLEERLNVLFKLGAWNDVLDIIRLLPEQDVTERIFQIKVETLLMKGDIKQACTLIDEKTSDTTYDKIRISCFLAQEAKNKAILAYDIYQENTPDNQSVFALLSENVLREIPTSLPENIVLEPHDVYLFSLAKNVTIDWTKQTRGVKMTLVDLPTTDIPLRITLAEQIGLDAEAMKKIYRLPLFNPDLNNHAVKRAYLHQQILNTHDNETKVILIKEWLDLIRKDGLFISLAPVIADMFNQLKATADYVDIAYDAVQAYALTDNLAMAEPWRSVLKDSSRAIHQKQFFMLTPIWQTLGGGYPYNLAEKMQQYCGIRPLSVCNKMKLFIDSDLYETEQSSQPQGAFLFTQSQKTTRLGETLLQGILDIHAQQDLDRTYQFIKEVAQKDTRNKLLVEGMIFNP